MAGFVVLSFGGAGETKLMTVWIHLVVALDERAQSIIPALKVDDILFIHTIICAGSVKSYTSFWPYDMLILISLQPLVVMMRTRLMLVCSPDTPPRNLLRAPPAVPPAS